MRLLFCFLISVLLIYVVHLEKILSCTIEIFELFLYRFFTSIKMSKEDLKKRVQVKQYEKNK